MTKKVHLVYIPSGRYRGGVGAALTARSTIATTFWLSKTESIENELMKKKELIDFCHTLLPANLLEKERAGGGANPSKKI